MSLYAIADLHLAISNPEKTMGVFGHGWENYIDRLQENWCNTVTNEDVVLVSGDISWATYMDKAREDFEFLNCLPGKKLLSRGNHDYWWNTLNKMDLFLEENGFDSISFVRTNCIEFDDYIVSGTRGWMDAEDNSASEEDLKIYNRELLRLDLCVKEFQKADPEHLKKRILMVHYPPLTKNSGRTGFTDIIGKGEVDICVYGHLHGRAHGKIYTEEMFEGVRYIFTSADYLKFQPKEIVL